MQGEEILLLDDPWVDRRSRFAGSEHHAKIVAARLEAPARLRALIVAAAPALAVERGAPAPYPRGSAPQRHEGEAAVERARSAFLRVLAETEIPVSDLLRYMQAADPVAVATQEIGNSDAPEETCKYLRRALAAAM